MQIDLEQIRRHYASLSDEALLDMSPEDLTPAARQCYDAECKSRHLGDPAKVFAAHATAGNARAATADEAEVGDAQFETQPEPEPDTEEPDWRDEATQVYSIVDRPGSSNAADADHARAVLQEAGIACYLEMADIDENTREWRLFVPGNLNLQATSILDRDIFNQDFENEWRSHLEAFSDEELLEMRPEVVFCGLFDRVQRAINTYDEELDRRGLKTE